jgi:hypothetical protein
MFNMKTTKILGCISIGILVIIMLDIYVLEGKMYKKTYDRRYSEDSRSRPGSVDREEFILTTDGSTYGIPSGTFIPLESGDTFTVEKTKLLNRIKSIRVGETDNAYDVYLNKFTEDPIAKRLLGIVFFAALTGLIGRLLRIRSDIRFAASFFSVVMAVGLLIFYLW